MPSSELFLIKRYDEYLPKNDKKYIPKNTRGIYALLKKNGKSFNVVYIGMAGGDKTGIHSRLNSHARSKKKKDSWDHFSIFEVHDNLTREIIKELEGLFRHIYRKDEKSQQFNKQKRFKKFRNIQNSLSKWNSE
ncbi:MAG: GIY-YIG nuclease family protein [Bacteroidota bacterium]